MDDKDYSKFNKDKIHAYVHRYSDALYSWAYYKTLDRPLAEDLVQDTFLTALSLQANFEGKSSVKTWLFGILNNKIADYYRHQKVHNKAFEVNFQNFFDAEGAWKVDMMPKDWEENAFDISSNQSALEEIMRHCLSLLTQSHYSCIFMRFFEEKESEAICQELSISATNYWQVMHRAKLQLRKCVETNGLSL